MDLFLLIGILAYGVASIRGRGRVVPVCRIQAVPSGHPPGTTCFSFVHAPPGPGLPCPCGSWEGQSSLPGDGVCNFKNRSWENWAGFCGFGCLLPSGREVASGQHRLLSASLVILSRELTCPKNKHSSAQPFFSMRRSCPTSVVVGRTGQGLGAIPRDTLLGKKEGGFWAPWVLECREFQVKWTYRASCQLHFKLFSFDILVVSSVFQSWV